VHHQAAISINQPYWEANMQKYSLQKMIAAIAVALLFVTSFVSFRAMTVTAAPAMQEVRAKEVTGSIPGGQFAQVWLAVEPETPGAQVTLIAEWDRNNPADQGLNFFILDDQGVRRVGDDTLSTIALGAGSANFVLNGPDNTLGASFNAIGTAIYTVVVSNESSQDANFTLRSTNAFIIDGSGQVTDPNAPEVTADEETSTEEATDTESPAASTAVTTTVATTTTTTTTTTTAPADVATTTTVTATATPAPAVTTVSGTARATTLSGSLPEQNAQHFLGLEPEGRDAQVTLRLTFEPQDSSELGRRLNFWVLDSDGFKQFLSGTDSSDVAIAAGNRVFRGVENERVANFRVVGSGSYTVLVYNNATVPGTYELSIEGGILVDDAGQTNEAQSSATTLSATGAVTTSTTATGTVATTATTETAAETTDTATTETTTETAAARTGEPGGTYTVQSGDTLALVARDIYGDLALYESLCSFNNITDCNTIEVGDVIQLPTQAQIASGAQSAVTPTAAATPAATPAAAATPAVSATESVSETTPSTLASDPITETATTTAETTDTATTESTAAADTIYATLVDNGNFTTLVKALDQSGLDSALNGSDELTLFAPTDAAFVALRNRFSLTEAQLLGLPELTDTLRYHVLSGDALSSTITDGMSATTLQGKDVRFEVDGEAIKINGANIIATDVQTANGIIHVIDAVIIPPAN